MRKLKKTTVAVAALILGVILLIPAPIYANANSAMASWCYGTPQFGTVNYDDCPLTVTHEDLIFDINSFPPVYGYYGDDESEYLKDYSSCVTAEYSFYNPTDSDITATLAFPFGALTRYYSDYMLGLHLDKYDITLNGEPVQKTFRATYYGGEFDTAADVKRLHDGYVTDEFYSPELTVTEYTYTISGIPASEIKNNAPYASLTVKEADCKKVIASSLNGGRRLDGGNVSIGKFVNNGEDITVYVLGEPLDYPLEFKIYRNGGEEKEIAGSAVLSEKVYACTFSDIALFYRKEDCQVSKTDWYNAVVEKLNDHRDRFFVYGLYDLDVTYELMQWYLYEISVAANSTAVNSVTAPLFPDIHVGYNPPVYKYDYLLSPAAAWSYFGDIDITVNTPYYLNVDGFEASEITYTRTDGGYTAHLSELPAGELSFNLCESQSPERVRSRFSIGMLGAHAVILAICCALILAILLFVTITLLTQRKKRKPNNG